MSMLNSMLPQSFSKYLRIAKLHIHLKSWILHISFGVEFSPHINLLPFRIVVFGEDGVVEQIGSGKGYIDMSTVDAETCSKISEAITSKGGSFLEAPVSGSKKPAEDGQLVILAAGEKALYEAVLPAFDVLGKKSFFLGQVGNGAKMKLVVNMIMGSMMNAFSEGLVLADKSGLNPETLLDVLDLGAIANPMFKLKGASMIESSYSPAAFPLKHQQKDMRLALALGDENAVPMPLAAAANEAFKKARSMGLGDLDFSAVHETVASGKGSSSCQPLYKS